MFKFYVKGLPMGTRYFTVFTLFCSVLLSGCISSSDEGGDVAVDGGGNGGNDNRTNITAAELTLHEFKNMESHYLTPGNNPVIATKSFARYTALVAPKLVKLLDLNDEIEKSTGFTYSRSYPLNPFSGLAGLIESVSYDVGDAASLGGAVINSVLSYELSSAFPEGAISYAGTRTVTTSNYEGSTEKTTPVFLLNSIAFDFLTQQGVIK